MDSQLVKVLMDQSEDHREMVYHICLGGSSLMILLQWLHYVAHSFHLSQLVDDF